MSKRCMVQDKGYAENVKEWAWKWLRIVRDPKLTPAQEVLLWALLMADMKRKYPNREVKEIFSDIIDYLYEVGELGRR